MLKRGIAIALKTTSYVMIILASVYCPTYLIIKLHLEPIYGLPAPRTMAFASISEGFALVAIGGTFLRRFERKHQGGLAVERRPGSGRIVVAPYEVQFKARPMLGIAFVIAGILLSIMGIIIIPFYYGL